MEIIKRAVISVNPSEAEVVDGFYSLDYMFGASNESTIRYGTVKELPRGRFNWLKEGDKIWFTQNLSDVDGFDENNERGCLIFPQEKGEIWAVTESRALNTILGIEKDGVVKSTPKFLACVPMVKKHAVKNIIAPSTSEVEYETKAECIENKGRFKKGDVIHFKINADYPAKSMKSQWTYKDGKRVLFIMREYIFGKERNGRFYGEPEWAILRALDEGDKYNQTSAGIFVVRNDINDKKGDAEIVYNHKDLKKGDRVKFSKRGFNSLELKGEKLYASQYEYIWFRYV